MTGLRLDRRKEAKLVCLFLFFLFFFKGTSTLILLLNVCTNSLHIVKDTVKLVPVVQWHEGLLFTCAFERPNISSALQNHTTD